MRDLLSKRFVTVSAEDRASDVSELIKSQDASHCVVVEQPNGEFLGVVRLGELAARPSERIFADLLSVLPALRLSKRTTSIELRALLQKEKLIEAVVLSPSGDFVGLVTPESLLAGQRGSSADKTSAGVSRKKSASASTDILARKVNQQATALREVIAQLDEFSYAIAHEMRTPLRAVRGYAVTLQEEYGQGLDENARDYLQRIVRASDRLDRLTLGVIAYREITNLELRIRKVNTSKLVAEVVANARAQNPSVKIEVEEKLPSVLADELQLRRCFSQLIENAIKFTPGNRSGHIRLFSESKSGRVTFGVEDNGIGVRAEHRERIFQLFEQVNCNQNDGGYGVGLAIVRKAIERMEGEITVVSDGRTGSCFKISLPVSTR